jgi:Ca2+-dependent lipid-binding protein
MLFVTQDPYVQFDLSTESERTTTLQDAGSSPVWPKIDDIQLEVDRAILTEDKMTITVKDEDKIGGDKVLGSAKVSLRRLCPRLNSEVEIAADLAEAGVVKGSVLVTAVLRPASKDELIETIPETAIKVNQGLLAVKKISVHNLKGGDSGFLGGGKQVRYLREQSISALC